MHTIIIEGVDKSGKTTLAAKLREQMFPATVVAWTRGIGNTSEALRDYIQNYLWPSMAQFPSLLPGMQVIYDRGFPSAMIYNQFLDGIKFDFDHLDVLIHIMALHKFAIIWMNTPWETIAERHLQKADHYVNFEQTRQIYDEYIRVREIFMQYAEVPQFLYDGNDEALQAFIATL